MSFEENILLNIKREYSGNEKYKFFLQQLNIVETELRNEQKKNLELLRQTSKLIDEIEQLKSKLGEFTGKNGKEKYVSAKAHNKLMKQRKKWMDLYLELFNKTQRNTDNNVIEEPIDERTYLPPFSPHE